VLAVLTAKVAKLDDGSAARRRRTQQGDKASHRAFLVAVGVLTIL
jgi:hypothetical protein